MHAGSRTAGASGLSDRICLAVRAVLERRPEAPFALRAAAAALAELPEGAPPALGRVLDRLREADPADPAWTEALAAATVRAAGALESRGDHAGARRLFELATELRPGCARTVLHAGRAARRAGDAPGALRWYREAQALDASGPVARLARIGEAMVSQEGERQLTAEIRRALRDGDREAAGVGLEARALVRCETQRCREAIRDLCVCALRYPDAEDRARAAERVADLLLENGELASAREALLLAHDLGTPAQRRSVRARLSSLCAVLGDSLGVRRWGGGALPDAVQFPAPAVGAGRGVPLPMIREWRSAVERSAGAR